MFDRKFSAPMLALAACTLVFAALFGYVLGALYPLPKRDIAAASTLAVGIYVVKPMVLFGLIYAMAYKISDRIIAHELSGLWFAFVIAAAVDTLGYLTLWSLTASGRVMSGGLGTPYLLLMATVLTIFLAVKPGTPRPLASALSRPLWYIAAITAATAVLLSLKAFLSHLFFMPLIGQPLWMLFGSRFLQYLDTIEKFPIFHARNTAQLVALALFTCALAAIAWVQMPEIALDDDDSRPEKNTSNIMRQATFGRRT